MSLVIPLRDEVDTLEVLIRSIRAQTRPPDEVVLVDGGSHDGTPQLAFDLTCDDVRFRLIEAGNATPGRGRNLGIAAATCDWIALTDGGIRLESRWLEGLMAVAEREGDIDVVYGTYEVEPGGRFETFARLAFVAPTRQAGNDRVRGPFMASSLLRRQAWVRAGGFPDLRAGEDLIFMRRLEEAGARVAWAPGALVWWRVPRNLHHTFARFRLYSFHNVLAGQQRDWHNRMAGYYVAAAPFVVLALVRSPRWATVPTAGMLVRAARQLWRHRHDPEPTSFTPLCLLAVAGITLVIDAATFVGWAQALIELRRAGPKLVVDDSGPNSAQPAP